MFQSCSMSRGLLSHFGECADDGRYYDASTTLDGAQTLKTDFGKGLMGTAKSGQAPLCIHVDGTPVATEGARTFEQDCTSAASAQWHSKHVECAQSILLQISGIQCFLGLITSYAVLGIIPLASSILGLVTSIQYISGDVSSLEKTLNRVIFLALTPSHCNRTIIESFVFNLDSRFASSSARCGGSSLSRWHVHLPGCTCKQGSRHSARSILCRMLLVYLSVWYFKGRAHSSYARPALARHIVCPWHLA
jgi:hypothetical protein